MRPECHECAIFVTASTVLVEETDLFGGLICGGGKFSLTLGDIMADRCVVEFLYRHDVFGDEFGDVDALWRSLNVTRKDF